MAKFSILIPTYNSTKYIKACVNSILAQSLNDFTIHILDSYSTDNTIEWIKSLNDKRIEIYATEERLTIEQNWGRFKDISKNEFMTILGHDDVLHPNYLAEMNNLIQKHPNASLYQTHFQFIDSKGTVTGRCKPMDEVQSAEELLSVTLAEIFDSTATGYMMRAKDYDEIGGIPIYPDLIFSDLHLWLLLTAKSYKATSFKECFSYRQHQSVSRVSIKSIDAFHQFAQYLSALQINNPEVKEAVKRYGQEYILRLCKGLSHRLLRIPYKKRNYLNVKQYIADCKKNADLLIEENTFNPESSFTIYLAKIIDSNLIFRNVFLWLRRIYNKPIYKK